MENEQKTNEKEEPENSVTTENDGDKPQEVGLIDKANSAAERLEKANKKQEELILRQEEITAKQMLSGRADAGQTSEKKEETDKEYSDRIDQEIRDGKYNG